MPSGIPHIFTDQRQGKLVFGEQGPNQGTCVTWHYKCDCGSVGLMKAVTIRAGKQSCGCAKRKQACSDRDFTGLQRGMLTVVRRGTTDRRNLAMWECECLCGRAELITAAAIGAGATSCGCRPHPKKVASRTHCDSRRAPEYRAWEAIKARCYKPSTKKFHRYGGRGIYVCDRWRTSYENFLADMGRRPATKTSIDRFPNNDGSYTCGKHDVCADCREKSAPFNCRWADDAEQNRNTSRNVFFTVDGVTKSLEEWAKEKGTTREALYNRRWRGGTDAEIVNGRRR